LDEVEQEAISPAATNDHFPGDDAQEAFHEVEDILRRHMQAGAYHYYHQRIGEDHFRHVHGPHTRDDASHLLFRLFYLTLVKLD
jgi:hypothetical protein